MASDHVSSRLKAAEALRAALESSAQPINDALKAVFGGNVAPGETLPDVGVILRAASRALDAEAKNLDSKSSDLVAAQTAVATAPAATKGAARPVSPAQALHGELVELRKEMARVYGPAASGQIGLGGRPPTDPTSLVKAAELVVAGIGRAALPKVAGANVDLAGASKRIEGHLNSVKVLLGHAPAPKAGAPAAASDQPTTPERALVEAVRNFDHRYGIARALLDAFERAAGHGNMSVAHAAHHLSPAHASPHASPAHSTPAHSTPPHKA
jgi:hypothetical protein